MGRCILEAVSVRRRLALVVPVQLTIAVNDELVQTTVLLIGTKLTVGASGRKACTGLVSKRILVAPAFLSLALVRVWVAERDGVAVRSELVCSDLKPVAGHRACAAFPYGAGVDKGG
jgi:hypothetical protein